MGLCRASTAHSGPLPGLRPSFLVRVPLVREKTIPPGERLLQDPTFFFGMSSPDGSICLKTSVFASFFPFSFPFLRDYSDRNGRRRLRESERGRHTSRHPSDSFFAYPCPNLTGLPDEFSRKEVFQPHLPVRLPCYDLAPVTGLTLGRSPKGYELQVPPTPMA